MSDDKYEPVGETLRTQLHAHIDRCDICQTVLKRLAEGFVEGDHNSHYVAPVPLSRSDEASTVVDELRGGIDFDSPETGTKVDHHALAGGTLIESVTSYGRFTRESVAHVFPDPPMDDRFIASVGRYQVTGLVAHGGMSTVYRAVDTVNERPVVLKVMSSWLDADSGARERISREADAAKRVRHPNVIAVYDFLLRKDLPPTVVMEQLSGNTLRHILSEGVLLGSRESAGLLLGAAHGLAACHEVGIFHRDVKPSNLLVETVGGARRLVVSDFGIARDVTHDKTLTNAGGLLGTPAYMSPEQIRDPGTANARSDVYSLGCVLYEMLAGRPPFLGSVRMLLWQATHETPRPPRTLNESVDRSLETICLKAIAANPAHRYATAAEFAEDIERYLAGKPIHARPASLTSQFVKFGRRYPIPLTIAGSLFVLSIGVATISLLAANRMAEARSIEKIALADASRNARLAAEQSELQKQAAMVAQEQSQLAFDTMTQVIEDVESGLQSIPQGSPIRKRLLETSLKNLDRAAAGFIERSAVSLQSAHAMLELAHLYIRFGGPPDGDSSSVNADLGEDVASDSAERLFNRAFEIAWQTYEEQGHSLESLRLAHEIKSSHGEHLLLSSAEHSRCEEVIKESLKLARLAAENSGDAPEDLWQVIKGLSLLSQLYSKAENFDLASRYLQESLDLANERFPVTMPTADETDFEEHQQRIFQYTMLATLETKAGRADKAREATRSAYEINVALAKAWEGSGRGWEDLAGARIANAFYLVLLGEADAALGEVERHAGVLEEFLAEEPQDQQTRAWLIALYQIGQNASITLGMNEDAANWAEKIRKISSENMTPIEAEPSRQNNTETSERSGDVSLSTTNK